jgi:hypothetical protein
MAEKKYLSSKMPLGMYFCVVTREIVTRAYPLGDVCSTGAGLFAVFEKCGLSLHIQRATRGNLVAAVRLEEPAGFCNGS